MGGKFELGRISGIPIVIDVTFLLLVAMFGQRYFMAGDSLMMSAGVVIILGVAASILIHELAHAWTGRYFRVEASWIELNGFGGLCHWQTSIPGGAWPRIAISLAGPLANLLLYVVFRELAALDQIAANRMLRMVLRTLASMNFLLFVFNLLPAFPLDGGKALEALLGTALGGQRATRVVAVLGLLVALWLASQAMTFGIFTLLVAILIGLANWQALGMTGGPPRR